MILLLTWSSKFTFVVYDTLETTRDPIADMVK